LKQIKAIAITACGAIEGVSRADNLAHEIFLNIELQNKACPELVEGNRSLFVSAQFIC
jgi:hypothetical protein